MLPLNSPSHNFDSISQIRNLADRRYSVATKKSYSVKLSAVARDLDRAIKALEKIQKKKATLAPDAARQLDQGVQDLSGAQASRRDVRRQENDGGLLVRLRFLIAQARCA